MSVDSNRTGLCSVTFRDLGVEEVARRVAAAGLQVVEWGADRHAPPGDHRALALASRACARHGLRTCSYGSYFRVGVDPAAKFLPVTRAARTLGAERVRVWAGAVGSADVTTSARREMVVATRETCAVAADHGLEVAFEYHGGTMTDTPASTLQLLQDVDRANVSTYWQPPVGLPDALTLEGLQVLVPCLSAVHVFSWWPGDHRRPLLARSDLWRGAFTLLAGRLSELDLLLEFVPGDDPAVLDRETGTLRRLIWPADA